MHCKQCEAGYLMMDLVNRTCRDDSHTTCDSETFGQCTPETNEYHAELESAHVPSKA